MFNIIRSTVLSLFCASTWIACATQEAQNGDSVFFDSQRFIAQQIDLLEKINPTVSRTNMLNDEKEELVLSNVDWKSELDLFYESDINKSSYLPSYNVDKSVPFTTSYTLKEEESLPVKFMQVVVDSLTNNPQVVRVTLHRQNKLFTMEKHIQLNLTDYQGQRIIKTYQVKGFQDVLLLGKTSFSLSGIVNF